jgi:hypothetical protein
MLNAAPPLIVIEYVCHAHVSTLPMLVRLPMYFIVGSQVDFENKTISRLANYGTL